MPGVTRGIEWIRCSVVMWHDVIWVEMTRQLDTWLDADLTRMTGKGHGARIRGDDRWYLSSFPALVRAVRGSIKIGKEIRAVEVCGRDPRVLVIIITFPVYQILWFTAIKTGTNDVVNLIFSMAVREFSGWGDHWSTVELGIRMVGTEKFCVEGIVDTTSSIGAERSKRYVTSLIRVLMANGPQNFGMSWRAPVYVSDAMFRVDNKIRSPTVKSQGWRWRFACMVVCMDNTGCIQVG
jgi:hypothetical protein